VRSKPGSRQRKTVTLVAVDHAPPPPAVGKNPRLFGNKILWKRVVRWLLTKEEPGVEGDLPTEKIHIEVKSSEMWKIARISRNDRWVQR
jgi:hypothetical protein